MMLFFDHACHPSGIPQSGCPSHGAVTIILQESQLYLGAMAVILLYSLLNSLYNYHNKGQKVLVIARLPFYLTFHPPCIKPDPFSKKSNWLIRCITPLS